MIFILSPLDLADAKVELDADDRRQRAIAWRWVLGVYAVVAAIVFACIWGAA